MCRTAVTRDLLRDSLNLLGGRRSTQHSHGERPTPRATRSFCGRKAGGRQHEAHNATPPTPPSLGQRVPGPAAKAQRRVRAISTTIAKRPP